MKGVKQLGMSNTRLFILGALVVALTFLTVVVTTVQKEPTPPLSEEGIPVPFFGASSILPGSVRDVGMKNGFKVREIDFGEASVESESVRGTQIIDSIDFIVTPDSATITHGAPLSAAFTPGKKVYGYKYTSRTAQTENEKRTLAIQGQVLAFRDLFPGEFFTSEVQRNDGTVITSFEAAKAITFKPLSEVKLEKNARYIIVVNDTEVRVRARNVTWCGNSTTETETGEQCDDGNTNTSDGCTNECRTQNSRLYNSTKPEDVNGDGKVHPADKTAVEACLGGSTEVIVTTQTAPPYCDTNNDWKVTSNDVLRVTNYLNANGYCGNGQINTGIGEQCDDGNTNNTDTCSNDCMSRNSNWHNASKPEDVTGDGKVNAADASAILSFLNGRTSVPVGTDPTPPFYDTNNDGVVTSNDRLRVINWLNANAWCGNGTPESSNGEECDDGNSVNNDTCNNECKFPAAPF